MKDFFNDIKEALAQDKIQELLEQYSGDSALNYSISDPRAVVSHHRMRHNEKSSSIEEIFCLADKLNKEIPYAAIINEKNKEAVEILEFIQGEIGWHGFCDWEAGTLLEEAYKRAKDLDLKISLGHTHPKGYGAICSNVPYTKRFLKQQKDKTSKLILESGIYDKYGGDYSEMLIRSQKQPLISTLFSIMSPKEDRIGFFEVQPNGKIVYHPLQFF